MRFYVNKIQAARQIGPNVPLRVIRGDGSYNGAAWYDPESPTKWTHVCSYEKWGTCPFPCDKSC
jgi:hypothetical protein